MGSLGGMLGAILTITVVFVMVDPSMNAPTVQGVEQESGTHVQMIGPAFAHAVTRRVDVGSTGCHPAAARAPAGFIALPYAA